MPGERMLKVGLVQMAMSPEVSDNLEKAVRMSEKAASQGADVICLPELFITPYFPREEDPEGKRERGSFLSTIPGLVTETLSDLARRTGAVIIGGSIYEAAEDGLFNTATVFEGDGVMLGKYRKTHIPHDECFYEQDYFTPGDTGFQVFPTSRGKVSVLICYDQWFPEAARCSALLGAEIIFYPTAIGTVRGIGQAEGDWQQAWENVMRGHAIANAVPVCAVNRVGIEGESEFYGGSFVCDAFGKTLARAGSGEEVLLAEIDMDHSERVREGWRFFHNRRPECYGALVQKGGSEVALQDGTPLSKGYHMPAEWARHDATWLSWPKNPLTFPEEVIDEVEGVFAQMAAALSDGELVRILVDDQALEDRAYAKVAGEGADMSRVRFMRIRSADVWIRDYGPSFLLHRDTGSKAAVKWDFNAWGAKYDDLLYDDIAGQHVVESSGVPYFKPGIVMEGGSIDVNGNGLVLTTEQCLLNRNRNPHLDRGRIEEYLKQYIAAPDVIWLASGIEGDDTDGHIDDFARFSSASSVLCAFSDKGENAPVLERNWSLLEKAKDRFGLELQRLPMPEPLYLEEEDRNLPASYANFYIGNKVVLLPVFEDPMDKVAIEIVSSHFPGREIVPIVARELVYGYGGIHCVTQQEPSERG